MFEVIIQLIYLSTRVMEENNYINQQLRAVLDGQTIVEPQLFCQQENRIRKMCVNPQCLNHSLICQEQDCEECGNNHLCCLNIRFSGLTFILNERLQKQKQFVIDAMNIQGKLLEQYQKDGLQTKKKYLQNSGDNFMNQVYRNKNISFLLGKQAKQFYQNIVKFNSGVVEKSKEILLKKYQESIKILFDEILTLQKQLFESFTKINQIRMPENFIIDSTILNWTLAVNLSEYKLYKSFIVKNQKTLLNQLQLQRKSFLMQALNYPKKVQVIYRASNNNFSPEKFHQKCDNVPNTLTIIRTQYGKTIAGFSQYTWNHTNGCVDDPGKHAFLLSLDLKQKMVPLSQKSIICCNSKYGPAFGGDSNLSYDCDLRLDGNNLSTSFPKNYNLEGQYKYVNNDQSAKAFAGSKYSQVQQYEVFRVIY